MTPSAATQLTLAAMAAATQSFGYGVPCRETEPKNPPKPDAAKRNKRKQQKESRRRNRR